MIGSSVHSAAAVANTPNGDTSTTPLNTDLCVPHSSKRDTSSSSSPLEAPVAKRTCSSVNSVVSEDSEVAAMPTAAVPHDRMTPTEGVIDSNLYSRQIGAFGLETMSRLVKMRVLITGLRGVGVETAKNLILSGPASVTLHDDSLLELRDLATNFYATEEDVKLGKSRAEACAANLASLNDYVEVTVHSGAIDDRIPEFDVLVCSCTPKDVLLRYNMKCRSADKSVGFIVADAYGLCTSLFVDFGENFVIHDVDGEPLKTAIVANISNDETGTVQLLADRRMPFNDGDHVSFTEVQGTTELNDCSPKKIRLTGRHTFAIGDTSKYSKYSREGIATEVKIRKSFPFSSLEHCCKFPVEKGGCLPTPDLGKFGRAEQLFFAVQALMQYQVLNGQLPSVDDSALAVPLCVDLADKLNKEAAGTEGGMTVDDIDKKVVTNVVTFADINLTAVCSFLGGVTAQEVVKFTGKYTPVKQWFFTDSFELINNRNPTDCIVKQPSRYADQIAVWGHKLQTAMADQNFFLVGAGALGCELIKQIALMGYCCSDKGKLVLTDLDNIEMSNLNRQFLFRRQHIGQPKSRVAAAAALAMNPALKVEALTTRVGPEQEELFNDAFWNKLDVVINALDNVPSRLYVDAKCVWHGKPLMESGTLGTKGNVQVVLPRMTESYGDSQDPPEESIPLCTLRHFPNQIEHTIEWSRDTFEGLFVDGPQQAATFVKDPTAYMDNLAREGTVAFQRERLQKMYDVLSLLPSVSGGEDAYVSCLKAGLVMFHDFFYIRVSQLLFNFPLDHVTAEGAPFWSGPKRAPQAFRFNVADVTHGDFVVGAANIYAAVIDIPPRELDTRLLEETVQTMSFPDFQARQVKISVDETDTTVESASDDELTLEALKKRLRAFSDVRPSELHPTQFEKDDDTNFHVAFMAACANLRARNYKIQECDRHKVKMIAGKIIPAIATTTAMVVGLVSIELLKTLERDTRPIEDFRNAFINLSRHVWVFSEPMPPAKAVDKKYDIIAQGPIRVWPRSGFTTWDKIELDIPKATLKSVMDYIEKNANVDVTILSIGNTCVYNSFLAKHKERLSRELKGLYESLCKKTLPEGQDYLACEMSCSSRDDQVDVVLPVVKVRFG
eukprot:Lankesteria_metandrocarpae@DN2870_c0_g1_i1.p1